MMPLRASVLSSLLVVLLLVTGTARLVGCVSLGSTVVPGGPDSEEPSAGRQLLQIERDRAREVWIYFPDRRAVWPAEPEPKRRPLIISLHGRGGSARSELERWPRLADRAGAIVVCIDCRGAHSGDPADYPRDEAAILAVREEVVARYAVDRQRVLLTGYSGGALPALWTALRRPKLWVGLALRSPSFPHVMLEHPDWAESARGLPIFVSYGQLDRPETRGDVAELLDYLRTAGHREPLLRVEQPAGIGHDGSEALPRIMTWLSSLPARRFAERPARQGHDFGSCLPPAASTPPMTGWGFGLLHGDALGEVPGLVHVSAQ